MSDNPSKPNNEGIVQISEISFFLSGGNFLHRKIDYLDETIIKNSEMYNSILDKKEKEMAFLKQSNLDLENFNDEKSSQINELKQKVDEQLSELIKKNEEIIQLQKSFDEYKSIKEKQITEIMNQLKMINDSKNEMASSYNEQYKNDEIQIKKREEIISQLQKENEELKNQVKNGTSSQEIEELKKQMENMNLLQQENTKLKNDFEDMEKEKEKAKNEIIMYQEKINILEQKLNSDPYYAREIMSKALYDFGLKMMSENN
jgi:epidermal growth factor receptor substrate 15